MKFYYVYVLHNPFKNFIYIGYSEDLKTRVETHNAGKLRNSYRKKGQVLPTIDTLIAATCIINHYTLVTRNIRHYPMKEIDLYNTRK